jgi:hypothetical protein
MYCHAVTDTEAELTWIEHASFFIVPMDCFQNNFLEYVAYFKQEPSVG